MEILKDEGIKIVRNYENIGELPQNFVKDFLGWIDREDVEFHDGLAVIEKFGERRYGYINRNFEIVIPVKYSIVRHFHEGYALVKERNEYILIDRNGKIVFSNSDKMRYLGEGVYLIFEKEHARYATIGEILATTRKNWEKISFKDISTVDIEKVKEASRKISTSYDVKRYFDLIVDGQVFSFDTKEEREEYEQKLLKTSKDEKHYTKK